MYILILEVLAVVSLLTVESISEILEGQLYPTEHFKAEAY